ncbi:PQQ-binding-like beta-propeller repeat protein [Nocardiopsis sp. B62]|uniref:outer membrane protein assembly factor BamB family protein n=1 Tax=Nocardiopsis sp. B62 TaxID=2824874 RepID=UPI001B39BED9|nr:PQQ-binding-like beta-propeller repeat protein [Nocardiopsis sp. B62]MBQ1083519.1 PQQ-binding-like beta-propeller repeat protein [Nocardiopsis sp. B62]
MRAKGSVWFGSGLFVVGSVIAVSGQVAQIVQAVQAGRDAAWAGLAVLGLVLLLVLGFVVNRVRDRRYPELLAELADREKMRGHYVDARKRADRSARVQVWTAVLVASALTVLAWRRTVDLFQGGVPDHIHTAQTAGITLQLVGALLFATALWSRPWPRVRGGGPAGAVAASTGALALALVHAAVTVLPVDATTTTERRVDPPPVPDSVSGIGWVWEAPEGDHVSRAATAGEGLVVLIGDGVVALNGETGEELWHHRRPGSVTAQLFTSADGATVMLSFLPGAGSLDGGALFVALDAHTGQVRAQDVLPVNIFGRVPRIDLFDDGYVAHAAGGALTGMDPESFARTWRFQAPEECRTEDFTSSAGGRDVVATLYECVEPEVEGSEIVILGLDPADGSEVWRHESSTSRTYEEVHGYHAEVALRTGTDGAVMALHWNSFENEAQESVVLDQADGTVIAEGIEEVLPRLDQGGDTEARQPNAAFDARGYLTATSLFEPTVEYTWHPFGGGEPRRTAPLVAREDEFRFEQGVALTDMLVTSQLLVPEDRDSYVGPAHLTVHGAPWDGGEPWELEVEFEAVDSDLIRMWPESTPLLRVPGALAIVHGGTTSVVGLV